MNQEIIKQLTHFCFALACVALFFFFPVSEYRFEVLVSVVTFLLVMPVIYTKVVLHKDLREMGFWSFRIEKKEIFMLTASVIIGGLLGFVMIAMKWGVASYVGMLPGAVLYNFGGFVVYELVFVSAILFLFTVIVWGFVFNCTWHDHRIAFISGSVLFIVLLYSFYQNIFIIIPLLSPVVILYKKRFTYNIIYLFLAFFLISLIIDTMIVRSLS